MLVRCWILFERTFKSLGAAHWKLDSLNVLTLAGPLSFLTLNVGPFLVFASFCILSPYLVPCFQIFSNVNNIATFNSSLLSVHFQLDKSLPIV